MLLFFYGKECSHCEEMMPLVDRLEKETGLRVERLESWHNKEHYQRLNKLDNDGTCGGVPFFVNTESKEHICGATDYEHLKSWATASTQIK
jgi:thiol-disulfide isomerase/thioredoxin